MVFENILNIYNLLRVFNYLYWHIGVENIVIEIKPEQEVAQ